MIHISESNTKLGGGKHKLTKPIRCFDLPPVKTCPYASEQCLKYCYAQKNRYVFEKKQRNMEENLQATFETGFITAMAKALQNDMYFRIHTSGDFYDLEYYEKWVRIAERAKHCKILAYTRNLEVLHKYHNEEHPENLVLIQSLDADQSPTIGYRFAKVVLHDFYNERHLSLHTIGKTTEQQIRICTINDCLSCLFCWKGKGNVAFPQRYKKHDA